MDNTNNTLNNTEINLTEEEEREISETIVITEHEEEPYKIKNSALIFSTDFNSGSDQEDSYKISGYISTEAFIQDTVIDKIETWRFILNNATVDKIEFDAVSNKIVYHFTAISFEVKE